ncbi:ADP-ribosyl cyclase/cyclic ADP-ribose hydrolase 1-like isoform X2 [Lepisosteus oculatus]|uniref:ADP-ribosyl cyclase/cyclic ADP-ribose hydrolase 1-like isoform X2 n=1 Tax=Lepisosteus oculatus TaxID=7918 RepID=UPI00073FA8D7|nr:PREDICTED: ADP-ribosyl cyclase/cyclic ADP-ribose hydrolase 1-like isoform X2 [Lepisosteus oculatus]
MGTAERGMAMERQGCCAILNTKRVTVIICVLILLTLAIAGFAVLIRTTETGGSLKYVFITRCKEYLETHDEVRVGIDCNEVWDAFQSSFVAKDPCKISVEAYDGLMNTAKQKVPCNEMVFWSKTKQMAHKFTQAKKCFMTLEDTLLGFIMDGLTWCGSQDGNDTYTSGCPNWNTCEQNPVRSFWSRASAHFAESACGNVTAMLNGSIDKPFSAKSIFGSVEIKKFNPMKINYVNVVLIGRENYPSTILKCLEDPQKPCGPCWD